MKLSEDTCSKARLSRDKRFDGMFFTAVHTTKIFCRPICPAPTPKEKNVSYFFSSSAALEAGFRPCLRCRPEAAPGSPVWNGTSTSVDRAIALIQNGFLNEKSVENLSDYLGISERHLRRLFTEHIGSSPIKVAQAQKLFFAKKLIIESSLSITNIAFAAGFKSIRRFNDAFLKTFERSPSDLRRKSSSTDSGLKVSLPYRKPYYFKYILSFFKDRAISNIEQITETYYMRTVRINDTFGTLKVIDKNGELSVYLDLNDTKDLFLIVQKIRLMFDLNSNTNFIYSELKKNVILNPLITEHFQLPGSWDIFEFSIRAILGQQVSVKAATTFASRIAEKYGKKIEYNSKELLFFPTADELQNVNFSDIGLTKTRAKTLENFVAAVNNNIVSLDYSSTLESFVKQLKQVKGIGDWTAQYIAMRGLSDPNAFPDTDLGIIKSLRKIQPELTQTEIKALADNWKPWRSYATLVLWNSLRNENA